MSNQKEPNPTNQLIDYVSDKIISGLFIILVKFAFIAIIAGVIFGIVLSIAFSWSQDSFEKQEKLEYGNSIVIESSDVLQQSKITIKDKDYYLPIKPDLTKAQKLMLMAIRVPEWGNRPDSSLDGDLDSFCPYQQRASEILVNPKFKQVATKHMDISKVFTAQRVKYLNLFKNTQVRKQQSFIVTFPYGASHPFTGIHRGVDLSYYFDDVPTPLDGVVSNVTWDNGGGGKVVVIDHEKQGIRTLYAHLSAPKVSVGQKVKAGEIIAISGNSSPYSMGAHLHFQILNGLDGDWNSKTQDPTLQRNLYDIMLNKYTSLAQDLTSTHLRTGFCDSIALERLNTEKSVAKWKGKEITFDDLPNLVNDLCLSQRPIDCGVWNLRSLIVLEQLFDKI